MIAAVVVGFVVAVKRCWVGLFLGRQTFLRYGDELAKVMKKAFLVGKVAALARDIERSHVDLADSGFNIQNYDLSEEGDQSQDGKVKRTSAAPDGFLEGVDLSSRRARIDELLGEWEEPEDPQAKDVSALLILLAV